MNSETLGQKVRRLREDKGMTQGDLMRLARTHAPPEKVLSRATISRVESDERQPQTWVMDAIASALGVTTDYLLDRPSGTNIPQPTADLVETVRALNSSHASVRLAVVRIVDVVLELVNERVPTDAEGVREMFSRLYEKQSPSELDLIRQELVAYLEAAERADNAASSNG